MRLATLLTLAAAGTPQFSPPAVLSACPAASPPRVVFPSDAPAHATGTGAVIWGDSSRCRDGEGARIAAIGAGEQPGAPAIPRTAAGRPIAPRGALSASGAPHGQIAIAGSLPEMPAAGLLIQGPAGGPFAPLAPVGGTAAPRALATAYLGDLALASAPAAAGAEADELRVHVERFFSHEFNRNVSVDSAIAGPPQALALALDYRSEALAVWATHGALYARLLPTSGAAQAPQRLAPLGSHPQLAALLSDDRRAIVAWSEQRSDWTAVYIDRSNVGVNFGAPELLERFHDPDALPAPAASPTLVRLSSEGVALAWAGSAGGHWVVRTAPVSLNGVGPVSTIAAPAGDALLADLAAGPDDDAMLLWTEPQPDASGSPEMRRQAIFAARGFGGDGHGSAFAQPQELALPSPVSYATVAIDPRSDRAVAVWQAEAGAIEYSVSAGADAP